MTPQDAYEILANATEPVNMNTQRVSRADFAKIAHALLVFANLIAPPVEPSPPEEVKLQ